MLDELSDEDLKNHLGIRSRVHRTKFLYEISQIKPKAAPKPKVTSTSSTKVTEAISKPKHATSLVLPKSKPELEKGKPIAILNVIDGPFGGKEYKIFSDCNILGRDTGADTITIKDDYVSMQHCRISFEKDMIVLQDIGSTTGTFIIMNKRQLLEKGLMFRIGYNEFKVIQSQPKVVLHMFNGVLDDCDIEITKETFTIGRIKENDLSLPDKEVSGKHAIISKEGAKYFIEDNNSTNK